MMDVQVMENDTSKIDNACAMLPQRKTYGAVVCAGDVISIDAQEGFLRSFYNRSRFLLYSCFIWCCYTPARKWYLQLVTEVQKRLVRVSQIFECRGHGTQADSQELRATQCGLVQRVNKLVSVQAFKQRSIPKM